jgi:hypothetical protein
MTSDPPSAGYSHRQKAPLCWLLYGFAFACFGLALLIGETPGIVIAGAVAGVIAAISSAFHHLTVSDQGERLSIGFGPLPLFRRTVIYSDIKAAELGRTALLDGWGIHMSVRGGWVWNLWGRECVVVHFKNGDTLRIGTDDAANLAAFLNSKVSS